MSILAEQQRETFRAKFIQDLTVTLRRLRIASDVDNRNVLFGMALGKIVTADDCKLLSWDEHVRLSDLALNASYCAARDARARSGVAP